MANRYWVGGTGTWDGTNTANWSDTSGGAGGQTVPTSADAVFFDGNSGAGTVTVSGTRVALSLNFTGFTGTLTGTSTPTLSVSGSVTYASGMTLTGNIPLTIIGTGTLTSGGKTLSNVTVNGTGITVTLGDALDCNTLTVTAGTFTTANNSITCSSFSSANSNTRTINLGSSTINVTGSGFNVGTTGGLTFNAGTSQINLSLSTATLSGGGRTFYNVSFSPSLISTYLAGPSITGPNVFNNLTINPASIAADGVVTVDFSANQTINGTLTCSGSSAIKRCVVATDTLGTPRTLTVGTLVANDCDFLGITIDGAAAGTAPTRAGDCGGNSGITFPAPKTVYWNLSGSQSFTATGWATSSGGTPSANNFPLAQDTAVINNDGSAGTILFDKSLNVGTIDMSLRTNAVTTSFTAVVSVFGDLKTGSGVTYSGTASVRFFSTKQDTNYTSSGKTFTGSFNIYGPPTGSFNLNDDVELASFTVTSGIFNTNNYNLYCSGTFDSSTTYPRTINLGSSTITINSGSGFIWSFSTSTNLTFNAGTSKIILSDSSIASKTFAGGSQSYYILEIGGGSSTSSITITGANTFQSLLSTRTSAWTLILPSNQTNTVVNLGISGSSGNLVAIQSSAPATSQATLAKAGGYLANNTDYLSIRSVIGSPASDCWYIGSNSIYTQTGPNFGRGFFLTQRINRAVVVLTSTTSATWRVPDDWNSASNFIHLIGAGGGGSNGTASGTNRAGGGGGGGGGYTKLTNQSLTIGSLITYQAGIGGAAGVTSFPGTAGTATSWNSGASTAGGGGGGSTSPATPSSSGGSGGIGSTFNGGAGGAGATTTTSEYVGGGGGGGAGGPLGAGGSGGSGAAAAAAAYNGGGGGNGGGSNGGNATSTTHGVGGNNFNGIGGGTTGSGYAGGGGGGETSPTSHGGWGIEIFGVGSGGGSGGNQGSTAVGGQYGSGGGGGRYTTGSSSGTTARDGVIVIEYLPKTGQQNVFLPMFQY